MASEILLSYNNYHTQATTTTTTTTTTAAAATTTTTTYTTTSGVGRCQKVCVWGGGGTQTLNLSTFGKEPI